MLVTPSLKWKKGRIEMSRPKSPERIQADIDKAIRKERRDRLCGEREAKRTIRARKRATHESVVRNGVPKVHSGGTELGIHDAIAYSPLVICAGCAEAVREILDADGLCEKCKYGKEVQEKHDQRKERIGDMLTGADSPPEAYDGNHRKESRRQNHE
jgi:hypothetical protein